MKRSILAVIAFVFAIGFIFPLYAAGDETVELVGFGSFGRDIQDGKLVEVAKAFHTKGFDWVTPDLLMGELAKLQPLYKAPSNSKTPQKEPAKLIFKVNKQEKTVKFVEARY